MSHIQPSTCKRVLTRTYTERMLCCGDFTQTSSSSPPLSLVRYGRFATQNAPYTSTTVARRRPHADRARQAKKEGPTSHAARAGLHSVATST